MIQFTLSTRDLRTPPLLIAVAPGGGRVQRFRHGFTTIPPMRALGKLWDRDPAQALAAARGCGFVIGSELQAHGVDFSFAPVLDVDYGESSVIGDRALHSDPHTIAVLAEALQAGRPSRRTLSVRQRLPRDGQRRGPLPLPGAFERPPRPPADPARPLPLQAL